jgi:uncharacterized iron-regulated membrane protein
MSLLLFLHRWVGVAIALFMLLWFSSGLTIAFLSAPSVDRAQRLIHSAALAPQDGWLSLGEALRAASADDASKTASEGGGHGRRAVRAQGQGSIAEARLARVDGRPVWLIEEEHGRRFSVLATDGAATRFDSEAAKRIARGWLAAEGGEGKAIAYIDEVDTAIGLRNAESLAPYHRLAVEDGAGTQIIVSSRTGEVAQISTQSGRALIYVGSWLHLFRWLDVVGAGEYRRDALTWAGFIAATGALTGLVIGWIKWKPGFFGRPTYARGRTQPYRETWLKYHFWAGLIGGSFALAWAASGFVSTNPGQIFSPAGATSEELARYRGGALPASVADWKPSAGLALGDDVVELGWGRLGDDALLVARSRDGARHIVGAPQSIERFSDEALIAAARRAMNDAPVAGRELIGDYDSYYYPNHRQTALDKPLPVLRVDFADAGHTSVYLDPVDGRLLGKFDASRRVYRWLYSAVHHWDFGWFHDRRLWNAWMAVWVSLGIVLASSAVVLGWRRLRRTIPLPQRDEARAGKRAAQTA